MLRAGLFHLNLDLTVLRVDVVELLLAAFAIVGLHFVVEEFVDMLQPAYAGNLQPQVVEACELVVFDHGCGGGLEGVRAEEHHAAEVEIIAQGAALAVYNGGVTDHSVNLYEVICVQHHRFGVFCDLHHPFYRPVHPVQTECLGVKEGVVGVGRFCDHADVGR